MIQTIFIYGFENSGRTAYAEDLRRSFGCHGIVNSWKPDVMAEVPGYLHLTDAEPPEDDPRWVHLRDALAGIGITMDGDTGEDDEE